MSTDDSTEIPISNDKVIEKIDTAKPKKAVSDKQKAALEEGRKIRDANRSKKIEEKTKDLTIKEQIAKEKEELELLALRSQKKELLKVQKQKAKYIESDSESESETDDEEIIQPPLKKARPQIQAPPARVIRFG